jgi:hypothetical protein
VNEHTTRTFGNALDHPSFGKAVLYSLTLGLLIGLMGGLIVGRVLLLNEQDERDEQWQQWQQILQHADIINPAMWPPGHIELAPIKDTGKSDPGVDER